MHKRAAVQRATGIPVWDVRAAAVRGRLDGRGRHPVQVASLPARPRADLGLQRAPHQPVEERDLLPHAACRPRAGSQRSPGVASPRRSSGSRRRSGSQKPRAQALRDFRPDDRSRRARRPSRTISAGDIGVRREVRRDAEPHRGLHLQHRLRAGRGRRAAGQPDALQPVLPGEARFLSREPGTVRLRRRSAGGCVGSERCADPVLQPRIGLNRRAARCRSWPADASTGRVGRYSLGVLDIQTGRRAGGRAVNELFRRAGEARHAAAQQRRRCMLTGRSVGQSGTGTNQRLRRRRHLRVLRQPDRQHLLGPDADRRLDRARTPATAAARLPGRPVRRAARAPRRRRQLQSGSRLRAARRHPPAASGSFRFSPRPKSIRSVRKFSGTASMAYVEDGAGRLETRDSNGEFAIEFQNSDRFSVNVTDTYEFLPRPFAIVAGHHASARRLSTTTTCTCRCNLGSSAGHSGNVSRRARQVLQRPQDDDRSSAGAVERAIAALARADLSAQRVDLAEGSFTNQLIGSRVTYTMTPMMFTSALVQYNSSIHARQRERAAALGVPPGQRALRRVQRGARHARPPLPRSGEPGTHRQDQPAVSTVGLRSRC